MIALCSKYHFIDEQDGEKKNDITWQRFKAALEGRKDLATNRGFRMIDGRMVTYEQQKRILRQTLGIGRRHSHRADRVSQLDS